MDEQRLRELFREAVGEPPPASFGRAEVVAASRRVTARRRGALAAGTLLGVGVLSAGLLSTGVLEQDNAETTTAGQSPPRADTRVAPGMPHTLGATPRSGVPGPQTYPCAPPDDVLAAQVRAVLAQRGSAVTGPPAEVPGPCPAGSRAVALPVPGGMLYVMLLPQVAPPEQPDVTWPDGRREHALMLADGRGLLVTAVPVVPGQPTALNDAVPELAEKLAGGL